MVYLIWSRESDLPDQFGSSGASGLGVGVGSSGSGVGCRLFRIWGRSRLFREYLFLCTDCNYHCVILNWKISNDCNYITFRYICKNTCVDVCIFSSTTSVPVPTSSPSSVTYFNCNIFFVYFFCLTTTFAEFFNLPGYLLHLQIFRPWLHV